MHTMLNDSRIKNKHKPTCSQGICSLLASFDLGLENVKQRPFSGHVGSQRSLGFPEW